MGFPGRFSACATTRYFYSISRARCARCIAPTAGRRTRSPSSSKVRSDPRSPRSNARATYSHGIRYKPNRCRRRRGRCEAECERRVCSRRLKMDKAEPNAASEDLAQIRESVRALCGKFPGEYWRALDRERAYPTEFVAALTKAGFLAALIPEQYGGSGLSMTAAAAGMEEIKAAGCNGAACHAQMYTMGTLLRHGSPAQKARWLPAIAAGELRLQAFGVTEPTSGSDTLNLRTTAVRDGDHYIINGQKIWTSRAEHSDLLLLIARTTPREAAKTRTGGLSAFLVDMRLAQGTGISVNPIRTMMNHAT